MHLSIDGSREPESQHQEDKTGTEPHVDEEVDRLLEETRLWRAATSVLWVAWAIVQANLDNELAEPSLQTTAHRRQCGTLRASLRKSRPIFARGHSLDVQTSLWTLLLHLPELLKACKMVMRPRRRRRAKKQSEMRVDPTISAVHRTVFWYSGDRVRPQICGKGSSRGSSSVTTSAQNQMNK